ANGHFYEGIANGSHISWKAARDAAEQRGGYLATITSQEENDFVFSLIDDDVFWRFDTYSAGPYIGGFQEDDSNEPAGGWIWVTGEPFVYTNWELNEPQDPFGSSDFLAFFGNSVDNPNQGTGETSPRWHDLDNNWTEQRSYVIEWEAVPEPSTFALLCMSAVGLIVYWRRRAS
ncbi:MAG: lectin-like protein, partial [Thermoguttaceae bacterium]